MSGVRGLSAGCLGSVQRVSGGAGGVSGGSLGVSWGCLGGVQGVSRGCIFPKGIFAKCTRHTQVYSFRTEPDLSTPKNGHQL